MPRWSRVAVAGALALVALPLGMAARAHATPSTHASARPQLGVQILADINRVRSAHHLRPVRRSSGLTASAGAHSLEMIDDGYFAHNSPGGGAFWRRIERYYGSTSFHSWLVGETLLWASPGIDAGSAVHDWLTSPEHRKILLDPRWQEIGVSALHATAAPGAYGGREATVVTADFGVRNR
jgi:uncharacterized protein YkwD